MLLGPLSEFYGRRPIYIISFGFFLIWLIPCAVAKNIGTELVSRFISGFAGSAFLSVAGGTVGDSRSRFWSSFAPARLPFASQDTSRATQSLSFQIYADPGICSVFIRKELQAPMMIFTASPFIGPPVGPLIAGFINQYTNW